MVPAAAVIYIGSDGKSAYMDLKEKTITVELIDSSGKVLPSGGDETKLSCKSNPAVVPIFHDMTKPFFYVRKVRVRFRSLLVAIAGVALRSRASFDVVEMSKCRPDEIFSPRTQHCHKYMCERPSCEDLAVKHATVTCEGTEEGQTCLVTCKPGYRPFKTFKMICLNKKWQGINRACVPVSCGAPRIPHGIAGECRIAENQLKRIIYTFDRKRGVFSEACIRGIRPRSVIKFLPVWTDRAVHYTFIFTTILTKRIAYSYKYSRKSPFFALAELDFKFHFSSLYCRLYMTSKIRYSLFFDWFRMFRRTHFW